MQLESLGPVQKGERNLHGTQAVSFVAPSAGVVFPTGQAEHAVWPASDEKDAFGHI